MLDARDAPAIELHRYDIEPELRPDSGMAVDPGLRSAPEPSSLSGRETFGGGLHAIPSGLHLDKGYDVADPGDQIELGPPRAPVSIENLMAGGLEESSREPLPEITRRPPRELAVPLRRGGPAAQPCTTAGARAIPRPTTPLIASSSSINASN